MASHHTVVIESEPGCACQCITVHVKGIFP